MTEARFDLKGTLAEVEALLAEAQQQAQQIQRQQKELQALTKQIGAELQSLTARKAEREEAVRALEANSGARTLAEAREVYAALADISSRHYMMQTQLETLRQREQWLTGQQTSLQRLVTTVDSVSKALNLADQESAAAAGRTVPAGEVVAQDDLARRLVTQREELNRQLAQRLQDGPMQSFSNLVLQAEVSQRLLGRDVERARTEVQNLKATIARSLGDVRFFMNELYTPTLDEVGLRATIRRYASDLSGRVARKIELVLPSQDTRYSPELESTAFRVAQECLRYAAHHRETGSLTLTLTLDPTGIAIRVFSPGQASEAADGLATLDLIRLYAQAVGGRFTVRDSGGDGLHLDLEIPLTTAS